MKQQEIREVFKKFFESKGHKWVESSSLLPTDSSVLFTTAGMQQFKPYYINPDDAPAKNVASIQKCLRTSDIDEVGDESHLTFFEMLGNFSFGGYWKKEAIEYAHEFITKEMGLTIDYVSVFGGEGEVPSDTESEAIWKSIDAGLTIKKFGRADNFWGPTGTEGPCGPTTEIYVNGLEVWNIVFNEYFQSADGILEPLKIKGIDTGMGLERLVMVAQKKDNIFETDLFEPIFQKLPDSFTEKVKRTIADHARAIVFLASDGVKPSNKDQGYILRRLMRRMIAQQAFGESGLMIVGLGQGVDMIEILSVIIKEYKDFYPNLADSEVVSIFKEEDTKFRKTINNGIKEISKLNSIDTKVAFKLFESFGMSFEAIKDIARDKASGLTRESFEEERKRHQEISRAGVEKKFGGHGMKEGLPGQGDLTAGDAEELRKKTRLHTATHVIVAALEKVLGQKLAQAGSDITIERLRFDFAFPRKITDQELREAEKIANDIVDKDLPVSFEEMDTDKAFESGAAGVFKHKYGPRVKVYSIGQPGQYFSRELCGGPHVTHTGEIGHVTITKEESVSGGNRRIRATIE